MGNIPHNTINPTKHGYGFGLCYARLHDKHNIIQIHNNLCGLTIFHKIFCNISHIQTECGNLGDIPWNTVNPHNIVMNLNNVMANDECIQNKEKEISTWREGMGPSIMSRYHLGFFGMNFFFIFESS